MELLVNKIIKEEFYIECLKKMLLINYKGLPITGELLFKLYIESQKDESLLILDKALIYLHGQYIGDEQAVKISLDFIEKLLSYEGNKIKDILFKVFNALFHQRVFDNIVKTLSNRIEEGNEQIIINRSVIINIYLEWLKSIRHQ